MFHPPPLALLTLAPLLLGTATVAQAQPAPSARQVAQPRRVVLPSEVDAAPPVVRVSPSARTYIFFDAPVDPASVRLEGDAGRVRVLEAGKHIVTLQALGDWEGGNVTLRADYADGQPPTGAALSLVPDPAQVAQEVEVVRGSAPVAALRAKLAETQAALTALRARCEEAGLVGLVLSRRLDASDFTNTTRVTGPHAAAKGEGLTVLKGWTRAATGWALVVLEVRNKSGQPLTLDAATLTSTRTKTPVPVRVVRMETPQIEPGDKGRLALEAEALPEDAGHEFSLEVREGATGRRLFIPSLTFNRHGGTVREEVKP